MDLGKVKEYLNKIGGKSSIEVQFRAIKTLHSKIQSKLIDIEEFIRNFRDAPAILINWINEKQQNATGESLSHVIQIILEISRNTKGQQRLIHYGGVEYFCEFKQFLLEQLNSAEKSSLKNEEELIQMIDYILENLAQSSQNKENISQSKIHNLSNIESVCGKQTSYKKENNNQQQYANEKSLQLSEKQIGNQSYSVNNITQTGLQQENQNISIIKQNQGQSFQKEYVDNDFIKTLPTQQKVNLSIDQSQQDISEIKNVTYKKYQPRILEKPQKQEQREEFLNLPQIALSDNDEKFLFDIGVQLKYGDLLKQKELLKEILPSIIQDYPVEIFRMKPDIIEDLVVYKEDYELQFLALRGQIQILENIKKTFQNYFSLKQMKNLNESKATQEFLRDDKQYIQWSYPSLNVKKVSEAFDAPFTLGGQLSFFEILELILNSSFQYMEESENLGLIYQLWKVGIDFLQFMKNKKPELVKQLVIGMIKRFSKLLDSKEFLYSNMSNTRLIVVSVEFFMILDVDEYESEKSSHLIENYFKMVLNPKTKCLLSQKQIKSLFGYAVFFNPKILEEDQEFSKFLGALEKLKNFENDNQFGCEIQFVSLAEFELFIKDLEEIIQALPYSNSPNIAKILVDTSLYAQTNLYSPDDLSQQKISLQANNLLLQALQCPSEKLVLQILEQIYENLHSDKTLSLKKMVQNPNNYLRQPLAILLLSNNYFATQFTLSCLDNENYHYLYLEILQRYSHLNSRFSIYYTFLSIYQELIESKNNLVSQKAQLICDQMKQRNQWNWFGLSILDLFSKDKQKRLLASKIITNEKVQEAVFSQNKQEGFNLELILQTISQQTINDRLLRKAQEIDFMEDFLDNNKNKVLQYFDYSQQENSKGQVNFLNYQDLQNLSQVLMNQTVDYSIRSSAAEQIGEMVLHQKMQKSDDSMKQLLLEIISYCINQVQELKLNSENKVQQQYIGNVLQFLNIVFIHHKNFPYQEIKNLYFNSFLPKNLKLFTQVLLNILINYKNTALKYHTMKFLQVLHFNFNFIYNNLEIQQQQQNQQLNQNSQQEYQIQYVTHQLLENSYHFLVNPIFKSKIQEKVWKLYPLSDMQSFYVDKFLVVDSEEELNQSIVFALQKQLINSLNQKIEQSIDINSLYQCLQNWFNAYMSHDEFIEPFFVKEISNIFQKLMGANTHNLQVIYGQNQKAAQKMMNLSSEYFFTILKRTDNEDMDQNLNLKQLIQNITEYVCSQQISYLQEMPVQFARERIDTIINIIETLTNIIQFMYKTEDLQIKTILQRKVLKQQFIDVLYKIFQQFPNNEIYNDVIIRFSCVLMERAEIVGNLNLEFLQKSVAEYLLIYRPNLDFMHKQKLKNLLKFMLKYSNLYSMHVVVEGAQALVNQSYNNQSLNQNQNSLLNNSQAYSENFNKLNNQNKQILLNNASLGWVIKYTEDREIEVRMLIWNILINLAEVRVVSVYKSLIDTCLSVIFSANESYGVVILALRFLGKVLEIYEQEEDVFDDDSLENKSQQNEQFGVNSEKLDKQTILNSIKNRNFLNHVKNLLNKENAPPIFYATIAQTIKQLCALDFKQSVAVISQLEMWEYVAQVLEPKFFENIQSQNYKDVILSLANVSQLLVFTFCQDTQILNYLLNCTDIMGNTLVWIQKISLLYEDYQFKNSFEALKVLDHGANSLIQFLHCCMIKNEDVTIFQINKKLEERNAQLIEQHNKQYQNSMGNNLNMNQSQNLRLVKNIDKKLSMNTILSNQHSINVFFSLSQILNQTQNQKLKFQCLAFLAPLLGGWIKGHQLLEISVPETNKTVAQILFEQTHELYKEVNQRFISKKDSFTEFSLKRNQVLQILAALLVSNIQIKQGFVLSGFMKELLTEIMGVIDFFIVEDNKNVPFTKTQPKKQNKVMGNTIASRTGVFGQRPINQEDLVYYIRVLKSLFADPQYEKQVETLYSDSEDLNNEKLIGYLNSNSLIYEAILKIQQFAFKNEEIIDDYAKLLCNFSSNTSLSKNLCLKLVEHKILTDLTNQVLKFESIHKKNFAWSIKILASLGSHKELRQVYFRTGFLQQCIQKFYSIWNVKQTWNVNNFYAKNLVYLFVSLSFYPDSPQKLLNDRQTFNTYIQILEEDGIQSQLSKQLILLLANCSLVSEVRPQFYNSTKIPPLAMSLITNQDYSLELRALGSQMIYNMVYKCNQGIQVFNKQDICNEIKFSQKEAERNAEKIQLINQQKQNERQIQGFYQLGIEDIDEVDEEENLKFNKIISHNLEKVYTSLNNEWWEDKQKQ